MVRISLMERFLNKINVVASEGQSQPYTTLLMESLTESGDCERMGGGSIYTCRSFSPEDTLNNDFFFDDEFAVPFDANLAEAFQSGDESTEERIECGRGIPTGVSNNINTRWRGIGSEGVRNSGCPMRMSESKSESCIYQSDQMSTSERVSGDERGCSPDLSEQLRPQPLFSSYGEACDGKPSDSLLQSCLSGSLSYDGGTGENVDCKSGSDARRIDCYNWSLNKQRYFLSFDRSPMKTTCSSSGDDSEQQSSGSSGSRVVNWATTAASRQNSDNNSSVENVVQKKCGKTRKTLNDVDEDKPLTTWQQVKVGKVSPDSSKKLTTWSKISRGSDSSGRSQDSSDSTKQSCSKSNTSVKSSDNSKARRAEHKVNETKVSTDEVEVKLRSKSEQRADGKLLNIYNKTKVTDVQTAEKQEMRKKREAVERGDKARSPSSDQKQDSKSRRHARSSSEANRSKQNSTKSVGSDSRQNKQRSNSVRQGSRNGFKSRSHSRSVNQGIQTSLVMTSQEVANKCLQTSLQLSGLPLSRFQRSLSGDPPKIRHRMLYSAGSLSKPLPDLSFLNQSKLKSKLVSKSLTEKTDEREEFKQEKNNCKNIAKSSIDMRTNNSGGELKNRIILQHVITPDRRETCKSAVRCKSADYRVTCPCSSSESRDSSPQPTTVTSSYRQRSRSSDSGSSGAYSGCSSSSSGIYPGSSDPGAAWRSSPGMTSASSSSSGIASGSEMTLNGRKFSSRFKSDVPRKPPRLFTTLQLSGRCCGGSGASGVTSKSSAESAPVVMVCNACNARNVFANEREYAKAMALSHPLSDKKIIRERLQADRISLSSSDEILQSLKSVEYLQISPVRSRSKSVRNKRSVSSDAVTRAVSRQPPSPRSQRRLSCGPSGEVKPAKSILVRNRRQKSELRHRSWSEPRDSEDLTSDDSRRSRPVSLMDIADEPEHSTHDDIDVKSDEKRTGLLDAKQSWHSLDSVAKNEGSVDSTWQVKCDEDGVKDYDRFRAKKSVSFSEKIFYHSSPNANSPQDSPPSKRASVQVLSSTRALEDANALNNPYEFIDMRKLAAALAESEELSEQPPTDFLVSPPSVSPISSPLSGSTNEAPMIDFVHKRELVLDVMKAVELLLKHFNQSKSNAEKVKLGSSSENPEIGRLVFEQLCPSIQAIVLDGLRPNVSSLFGKVKNTPWRFAEDSAETGQSGNAMQNLIRSLKNNKLLNTPWLLFNAFIAGLLNYRALDFWLTYIHSNRTLLTKHYTSTSFLSLSNSSTQRLFLDMITSLQPLTQLPLHLEYGFERSLLSKRHMRHFSTNEDHVSRSLTTHMESQIFLTQWDNMAALNEIPEYDEYEAPQWRNRETLSRRDNQLDGLTSSGIALAKTVLRGLGRRQPRPLSLPGNFLLNTASDPVSSKLDDDDEKTPTNETGVNLLPRWSLTSEDSQNSSVSSSTSGLWHQFTRQIKDFTSVKERINSWRGSFTESFDRNDGNSIRAAVANATGPVQRSTQPSSSDTDTSIRSDSTNTTELSYSTCTNEASTKSSVMSAETKQHSSLSESSNTNSNGTAVQLRRSSDNRKAINQNRWSDFGINLVKFVDRLLLSESTTTERSMKTHSFCRDSKTADLMHNNDAREKMCSRSRSEEQINKCVSGSRSTEVRSTESCEDLRSEPEVDSRFYSALCHYVATDENRLSFEKGTLFAIVSEVDCDWLMCRHGNEEGLVHRACIRPVNRSASSLV